MTEFIVTASTGKNYIVKQNTDNQNGIGIKIFTISGKPLYASASIHWWDLDKIRKYIEENITSIQEREAA